MKKVLLFSLFCAFSFAQAFALEVQVSHAVFQTSDNVMFTEVYTHYIGKTLTYKPLLSGSKMGAVQVLYVFKQGETIVKADKILVTSPQIAANGNRENFVDMRRYALPEGEYTLDVSFTDEANPTNTYSTNEIVSVHFDNTKIVLSDIESIGKVTPSADQSNAHFKNGAIMSPYVLDFYPYLVEKLQFYIEIYNTEKILKDDFVVRYYLRQITRGQELTVMTTNKRTKPAAVVPVLGSIDLTQVPSGVYDLVIEVRDRKLELIATKSLKITRSNPYMLQTQVQIAGKTPVDDLFSKMSNDSCKWSITALFPRFTGDEANIAEAIYKKNDTDGMRRYLFSYWARLYPTRPQAAYREYMTIVSYVDEQFWGSRKGHQSDRGRIFLKYGKPDRIEARESEIGAPPYEVWTYENLNERQNLAKFIFANESLAGNDYTLLHSTARGEKNDPQWERKLYKNDQSKDPNYIDGTQPNNSNWGSNGAKALMDE